MNRGAALGVSVVDEAHAWLVSWPGGGEHAHFELSYSRAPHLVVDSVAARALNSWHYRPAPAPQSWRYAPALRGPAGGRWIVEGGWKGRRADDYLASLMEPSPLSSMVHRLIEEQAADARRLGLM